MNLRVLTRQSFTTSRWPGGTTTELFIHPPTANYAQRNFDFRLSTATVEVEQSLFTALPGYARKLMVLGGQTTLYHKNHHTKTLHKFEVDAFEGDWETRSVGKCTDFNVMTHGPYSAALSAHVLQPNQAENYSLQPQTKWCFIYLSRGSAMVFADGGPVELEAGALGIIHNPEQAHIELKAIQLCEVVFVEINQASY